MTEDFGTEHGANAENGKATADKARKARLAEELRANLKRRKAAVRRNTKQGGEPPSDEA